MKTRVFTSGILLNNGKILILKRRSDEDTHPDMWDCLGGHFKEDESAEECMLREAKEECGLDVRIKQAGKVFEYNDVHGRAVSIPFLLESDSNDVKLSEHTDYKWVEPKELEDYNYVPDLMVATKMFGLI